MNKENYQIIREIAYNLPNPDRDIIMLYLGFYYGKSYNKNEIADMLSISQSTVSKLIGKNLKIIKKHLIKEGLIKEEIKNIKEIRKYLEKHSDITNYQKIPDKMQTTGGKIGSYLQEYKEEIIEISNENSDAKYICDYFGWLGKKATKKGKLKEDNLKEIRNYLEEHSDITNYCKISDKMQTTGGKIGNYLYYNKEKIIEISKENSDAKYICDYFGWLEKKATKEDILKEVKEYLKEHPGITNYRKISDRMQTTGGKIGRYLHNHKEEIIEISDKNSDAKYICDYFGWLEKKATKEDILKEIRNYLEEHPGITNYYGISDKMQTTGGKIGSYLSYNKEKIIKISDENSDAKYVCDYFGWLEKKATKEDILKEIRNYLEEHSGITNYHGISDKMQTTGGNIRHYLSNNKEKIKEISDKNSDAKYICDYFGWLEKKATKEDILKEVREYLEEHPGITNYYGISYKMQTTRGKIGNYLFTHKKEIIKISDENSDAKYICDYFGWNITKEDILKEIRNYLEEHPGITNYYGISDKMQTTGGKIGYYLSKNKEKIKEISNENSDAKYICDYFKWIVVNDELNVDYNYIDDQIIKDNLKIKMMNKK